MKARTLLLLAALAVSSVGCVERPASPARTAAASLPATQAIAGGGVRANLEQDDLRFSAEVTRTLARVDQGRSIVVRLRLTNTGAKSVTWTNLRFGWEASILDPKGETSRVLVGLREPPRYPGYRPPPPLTTTLAPGESTSAVIAGGPVPGTYTISSGFNGDTGPSGTAPEFSVVLLSSRRR